MAEHLEISMREYDDGSWRQRCEMKMEELKQRVFSHQEREMSEEDAYWPVYVMENVYLNFVIYKAIKEGDPDEFVEALESICRKQKLSLSQVLDQKTHGGDSMLHVAAKHGREKIAELVACQHPFLLRLKNIKGNTALHEAAARPTEDGSNVDAAGSNVIKVILSQLDARPGREFVEDITRSKNRVGNTALHEAVLSGNLLGVAELYRRDKAATHELNNAKKSPLYIAVYNYISNVKPNQGEEKNKNAKAIVRCLLQDSLAKSKTNQTWCSGQSPLHAAIEAVSDKRREQSFASILVGGLCGRNKMFGFIAELLEKLVKKRPEMIYLKDEDKRTPLHYAALCGYLDGVSVILENYPLAALDADINGDLPIHLACKSGKIEVVEKLLHVAAGDGEHKYCPYVGGMLNLEGQNILHAAAKEGKYDVVKYIMTRKDMNINLNETDVNGNTPLHLASENKHPLVLLYLTRDKGINLQCQNNEGLTARDIALNKSSGPTLYAESLSHAILSSANVHCKREHKELQPNDHEMKRMKDLVNTLVLVAILIATVTFAAGFTVPGSVYGSEDPNPQQRGVAVLAKRTVFQIFMVCNTTAMYSSTVASFILLWAQRGDYQLARNAFNFSIHLVALALLTMSAAFMAAANLVVGTVHWLSLLIRVIGVIFVTFFVAAYILFVFPLGSHHRLLRPISNVFFRILIPFAYGKAYWKEYCAHVGGVVCIFM